MLGGKPVGWVLAAVVLATAVQGSARAQAHFVAFGDSYVSPGGAGLRAGQRSWVAQLGEPVRNLGHPGDGIQRTLAVVRRSASQVHGTAVLAVGINDVRRSGTSPGALKAFTTRYDEALRLLRHADLVVVVPPLPIRDWGAHGSVEALMDYRAVVIELAGRHPNARLADAFPAWRPDTMLLPDGIHPNAAGRAAIVAAVRQATGQRSAAGQTPLVRRTL
jgi:lysophospholipase L1-like esterase